MNGSMLHLQRIQTVIVVKIIVPVLQLLTKSGPTSRVSFLVWCTTLRFRVFFGTKYSAVVSIYEPKFLIETEIKITQNISYRNPFI